MQKLLITLFSSLLLSVSALASSVTPEKIAGIWLATLDIEGSFFVVELTINEDGTFLHRSASIDEVMPKPGCSGTYEMTENIFATTGLDCSAIGIEDGDHAYDVFDADFSGVTEQQLDAAYTEPIKLNVSIYGGTAPFKLRRLHESYFKTWDEQNESTSSVLHLHKTQCYGGEPKSFSDDSVKDILAADLSQSETQNLIRQHQHALSAIATVAMTIKDCEGAKSFIKSFRL